MNAGFMPVAADYPFLEIFWTMVVFFVWVGWLWLVVTILADVFHRSDLSGWSKAAWTALTLLLPFLGVFSYIVFHGKELGERRRRATELALTRGHQRYTDIAPVRDSGAIDGMEMAPLPTHGPH